MRCFAFALLCMLAAGVPVQAVIVVEYQTAASTSNATISPSVVGSGATGDPLAAGSGLTAASGSTYNWSNWGVTGSSPYTTYTTFSDAVANGKYWTWGFDITSAAGISNPTTMDIRLDRSGTGPNKFEVQASVNGGTAVSLLSYDFGDADAGVDFVGVDISSIGTLSNGDSVVFTMAAFGQDSGGASSGGTFDLETVDFNGSDPRSIRVYAVPEPSAFLFGGLVCSVLGVNYARKRMKVAA